jgi:hypothetical protein
MVASRPERPSMTGAEGLRRGVRTPCTEDSCEEHRWTCGVHTGSRTAQGATDTIGCTRHSGPKTNAAHAGEAGRVWRRTAVGDVGPSRHETRQARLPQWGRPFHPQPALLVSSRAMEKIDIWRTAALLVQQHGEEADLEAACHMDSMIERGDPRGDAAWRDVMRAIEQLQRTSPQRGGKVQ